MLQIIKGNIEFFGQYKEILKEETDFNKMLATVKTFYPQSDEKESIEIAKKWCEFREVAKRELIPNAKRSIDPTRVEE